MSFEDQFLNFCLSCDGSLSSENEHSPYCSQSCRQADLEKSGSPNGIWSTSTLNTPTHSQPGSSFSSASSFPHSFPPTSTGFHLPPAIDFTAYRRHSSSSEPPSRAEPFSNRRLSIGSSAGASVSSPTANISAEAKAELRRYESLFVQTRQRGNRSSWS